MKRITFFMLLFLLCIGGSRAQVQVGEGSNVDQPLPIYPNYGYTYSQSIYLGSEINAAGNITSIKWKYTGINAMPNSQNLVVYIGYTSKTEFASESDWEDVANLTQVYSGGIVVSAGTGWATITFDQPFAYNGLDNLVVAVDENKPGYDSYENVFHNTAVTGDRSIYAYSDEVNVDPANPNFDGDNEDAFVDRGVAGFVPNIIFGGIQQACPTPTALAFSNATATSAQFTWQVNGTETAWQVLVLADGSDVPTSETTGVAVSGTAAYTSPAELASGSVYQFYVRANCGDGFSSWTNPLTFTTLCDDFGDFEENLESTPNEGIPDCWYKLIQSEDQYAYIQVYTESGDDDAENKMIEMGNSDDAQAQLFFVSPKLSALPLATNRLRFKARAYNDTVIVGTMTDRANPSTFTAIETIPLTDQFAEYYVNIPATTGFIAFKHGLGHQYSSVYLDDIVWEPLPTVVPDCIPNITVSVNEECGNFATAFEWEGSDLAEGYKISLGTASGVYSILDNVAIGNVTSYSYEGNIGTTYYYKIVPFNGLGAATACTEGTFTTSAIGCYCTSLPTSVDNDGVTSVQVGTVDFDTTGGQTYYDNTDPQVTLSQGLYSNVKVTFETHYTYDTHIWIDFNDNYRFDANERVFTGVSTDDDLTILNASFIMPATAPLGVHAMRIGTADNGQQDPDPCYSDAFGVTLDFKVNIIEASCTPTVVSSSTAVGNCASNQYFVDVNVVTLGSGTHTITDGTTTYPVTATGIAHIGPFDTETTVSLSFLNGGDGLCDFPLGDFGYICPPVNDDCSGAVALTVNADYDCAVVTNGTVKGATDSLVPNVGEIGTPSNDVWYTFVATATTQRVSLINVEGSNTDMVHEVFEGTCNGLTSIYINDGDTSDLSGLTVGATYYVRVFTYYSFTDEEDTTFDVCIGKDPALGTGTFNNAEFTYYPNPVNNVLNLSYAHAISDISVYNLLGQQVIAKTVNSNNGQIDMSGLSRGTYMVKVTADNQVKTIKVIKE